jgi:hypothetical protein
MSLSRIVLAGLIVLIGLGIAAGVWVLVTSKDKEQEAGDGQSHWLEDQDLDLDLPPPENAWKPTTWYSEVADGTLFPNQPSPSFRIPADSSFHRAIARRELEDHAANEPTKPHPTFPSSTLPSSEPHPPVTPDELEALAQIPTVTMRVVPVKDNLPTTLKMRAARPSRRDRSTFPLGEQDALLNRVDTIETPELVKDWSEESSGIKGFTEAIHLGYYEDLDAIAISFTACSVRNSSDVPEVFQTINQKLEQLLAEQEWHQHALLLDIAGLQVAAEAQIAWELVLDGFVSQSCPEVAPNRVLAVQYDSSRPPETRPADENVDSAPKEILQPAGNIGGQPALLAVAHSFDEAVGILQHMRTSM